jgi:hypothetical protein
MASLIRSVEVTAGLICIFDDLRICARRSGEAEQDAAPLDDLGDQHGRRDVAVPGRLFKGALNSSSRSSSKASVWVRRFLVSVNRAKLSSASVTSATVQPRCLAIARAVAADARLDDGLTINGGGHVSMPRRKRWMPTTIERYFGNVRPRARL